MIESLQDLRDAAFGPGRRPDPILQIKTDGRVFLVSKTMVGEAPITPYLAGKLREKGIIGEGPGFYEIDRQALDLLGG